MTASNYIKQELKLLVEKIPSLKAVYEFHEISSSHLIEIFPLLEYEGNDLYKNLEEDFVFNFIELYPDQTIVFVSENDSVKPKEDFIVCGNYFLTEVITYNWQEMPVLTSAENLISYQNFNLPYIQYLFPKPYNSIIKDYWHTYKYLQGSFSMKTHIKEWIEALDKLEPKDIISINACVQIKPIQEPTTIISHDSHSDEPQLEQAA